MSLGIDEDAVLGVLLAGEWYTVDWRNDRSTFCIDAFEFLSDGQLAHGAGPGFEFNANGSRICGPVSSIMAVETSD